MATKKAKKQVKDERTLGERQDAAADQAFDEYDFKDVVVLDSDGWETDGDDRVIRRFYYENSEDPSGDSLAASFCVNFKKGTDKVKEAYPNW